MPLNALNRSHLLLPHLEVHVIPICNSTRTENSVSVTLKFCLKPTNIIEAEENSERSLKLLITTIWYAKRLHLQQKSYWENQPSGFAAKNTWNKILCL